MKRKTAILALLIMVLTLICCGCGNNEDETVIGKPNDNIEFKDVTVKKYVLKALGKKPNEEVTFGEATSLKSLKIDRTYRNFVTSAIVSGGANNRVQGVLAIDLYDLRYFTGLEELEIQNLYIDNIIGWENINKCTNLTSLKMNYYEDGFDIPLGAKPLISFAQNLKNLKVLDCGHGVVTQSTISKIKSINSNLELKINKEYTETLAYANDFGYDLLYSDLVYGSNKGSAGKDTLIIENANEYKKVIDSASATDIKYIYIVCKRNASVDVDCKDFLKFTNLETLSITEYALTSNARINNIKDLSSLEYLSTLCLFGTFDPDEIKELKHLDSLSVCGQNKAVNFSNMNNLKKVCLYIRDYSGNSLPKSVEVLRTNSAEVLSSTPELKILFVTGNGDTNLSAFKSCSKLKYYYNYCTNTEKVDMSAIKNAPDLEYFMLPSSSKVTAGFDALCGMKKLRAVRIIDAVPSEIAKLTKMDSIDTISYLDFHNDDAVYSENEWKSALGINGTVTTMMLYYSVPAMKDLYKSGTSNHHIMVAENTKFRDTMGFDETFAKLK